ncbi:MAG TPA: type II toxin-antitoxin system prevent-host-death family antitoxin [Polyangiaceae bacterium]
MTNLVTLLRFTVARREKPHVYNIAQAKAHLPELVERASAGETIIVARAGKPKARLVPLAEGNAKLRVPGKGKGRFKAAPDFDDPLPPDVIALFAGGRR